MGENEIVSTLQGVSFSESWDSVVIEKNATRVVASKTLQDMIDDRLEEVERFASTHQLVIGSHERHEPSRVRSQTHRTARSPSAMTARQIDVSQWEATVTDKEFSDMYLFDAVGGRTQNFQSPDTVPFALRYSLDPERREASLLTLTNPSIDTALDAASTASSGTQWLQLALPGSSPLSQRFVFGANLVFGHGIEASEKHMLYDVPQTQGCNYAENLTVERIEGKLQTRQMLSSILPIDPMAQHKVKSESPPKS